MIGENSIQRHLERGVEAMGGGKTVTRADLCEAVYQKVGLSRTESAQLVELVLDEISACIVRGESVKLSSFGSFIVRSKGERVGRNPKTGEEVPISPRRVMVFKPSNVLKQKINGGSWRLEFLGGRRRQLEGGVRVAASSGQAVTKSPDAFRTISEVAEDLDLPQHVLRFWETRFTQIKPLKRGGGRRYYRPDDIDLLRGIRYLLYGEGYTIRGVQRILKEQGAALRHRRRAGRIRRPAGPPRAGRGDGGRRRRQGGLRRRGRAYRAAFRERPAARDNHRPPPVAVDRDDHAPDDDDDDAGVGEMARRLVGRVFEGRAEPPRPAGLAREDADRLQAVLADLLDCKRLLDQAR